jgi:pimeloyl-ACP methyl ester carboxylesterase
MVGTGKVSWRMIGGEIAAAGTALLSMPLRWLVPDEHLDRTAPDAPPVVFVHGFLGDPTNFMALRGALAGRSFASFAYRPRLYHPTVLHEVAVHLGPRARAVGPATRGVARAAA